MSGPDKSGEHKEAGARTVNPAEQSRFHTDSGIPVKAFYGPEDLENKGFNYIKDLNDPGQPPFTRGIDPDMYRHKPWTETIYMGYGTAEDCNRRLRDVVKQGQNIGLYVALDLPTQLGYDSDHPAAEGEVGRVGVAVDSLADIEALFEGVDFTRLRHIGAPAMANGPLVIAMLMALGEKRGVTPDKYVVSITNDVLREYITRGTYIFSPDVGLKLTTDVLEYCAHHFPHWKPLQVHGHSLREAGGTAIQEIAFSLAFAFAYIESVVARGVHVDEFAPQFGFRLTCCMDLFEEVAKLRTVRKLWSKLLKERYGASRKESLALDIQIGTSGSSLTAQQPLNNVVRVTIEALAAVLGGVQQVRACAMDEALSVPSEESLRLALRTQQIIALESGVSKTVDPLAGSYYLEYLTRELESRVMEYLKKVDRLGGALKAVEQGYFQREIEDASYKRQKEIQDGDHIIVGLNQYQVEENVPIKVVKRNPEVEKRQRENLAKLKARRDNNAVTSALADLKEKETANANSIEPILNAVKQYATVGEIFDTLRSVHGAFVESIRFY
jgi:methylmalonyl-CoA mutase, N-terminal domain